MLILEVEISYKDGTPDEVKKDIGEWFRLRWFEFDVWELSDTVKPYLNCTSLQKAGTMCSFIKDYLTSIKEYFEGAEIHLITYVETIV